MHPSYLLPPTTTVRRVLTVVCHRFKISKAQLLQHNRRQPHAWVRQIAMFLAHEHCCLPENKIGDLFGHRDHATVSHACEVVKNRMSAYPAVAMEIKAMEGKL